MTRILRAIWDLISPRPLCPRCWRFQRGDSVYCRRHRDQILQDMRKQRGGPVNRFANRIGHRNGR